MPVRAVDDKPSDTLVVVSGEGSWTGSSTLPISTNTRPCSPAADRGGTAGYSFAMIASPRDCTTARWSAFFRNIVSVTVTAPFQMNARLFAVESNAPSPRPLIRSTSS